jgi:tetratricopeptide (TPR) repeat protein
VEVKPPPAKQPPAQADTPADAAPPTREISNLDECAEQIRDGRGLPASGAGRELYERALSEQRAGNLAAARRSYFELIEQNPASPFIPLAYLAFGDLFREQAKKEPSHASLAISAYRKVTTFPPSDNTAYAYALLRIADMDQKRNANQALAGYARTLAAAADSPCPDALGQAARDGLTATYVGVGRPDRAWAFFRHAAPDDATAARMLAALVDKYNAVGRFRDGCQALRAASDAAVRASPRMQAAASHCGNAAGP